MEEHTPFSRSSGSNLDTQCEYGSYKNDETERSSKSIGRATWRLNSGHRADINNVRNKSREVGRVGVVRIWLCVISEPDPLHVLRDLINVCLIHGRGRNVVGNQRASFDGIAQVEHFRAWNGEVDIYDTVDRSKWQWSRETECGEEKVLPFGLQCKSPGQCVRPRPIWPGVERFHKVGYGAKLLLKHGIDLVIDVLKDE
jgi:hypothetical protein